MFFGGRGWEGEYTDYIMPPNEREIERKNIMNQFRKNVDIRISVFFVCLISKMFFGVDLK